ncbi:MAG: c-type cytochrome [Anaerolineae bacterium]|nr:MAG: c-type cytochrome [Anaerolineae bacterium]
MKHSCRFAGILLALAAAALFVLSANAHSALLASTPEGNAILEDAPVQVELLFSEPVEEGFSSIDVLDSAGRSVAAGPARLDPANAARLVVSLRSLPDGIYTVSWRALSSVDGHITSGAFAFGVGDMDAAALTAAGDIQTNTLSAAEVLARWALFSGLALMTGTALFRRVVWEPVADSANPAPPWAQLIGTGAALALAAILLFFCVQAGLVQGQAFAAPWSAAASALLLDTRGGVLILARLALTLLAAALLLRDDPRAHWGGWLAAVLALLAISLNSHAAAQREPFLPILADWLHLLGSAHWGGGLFAFLAALGMMQSWPLEQRRATTARLVPRFSAVAIASVSMLALTGLYSYTLGVGSLEALTTNPFGLALSGKTLLVLPLLALGALNLLWTRPRLAQTSTQSASLVERFEGFVRLETLLVAGVLLGAALMTSLPPAKEPEGAAGIDLRTATDDLRLTLEILPGRVGLNEFRLYVESDRAPLEDAREVSLQFTPTTLDLAPGTLTLENEGGGWYSATGANLSLADSWQIQAAVRRESAFDAFANFEAAVGVANQARNTRPWAAGLVGLAAIGLWQAWEHLRLPRRMQKPGYGLALALGISSLAIALLPPAQTTPSLRVNPIAPNAASLLEGAAIYDEFCVVCHGPQGRGDGPAGLALNPPPANLSIHTAPGVHPDGQLYLWISEGVPGTAMPAFQDLFSEDERWHLVNYIRSLYQP